MDHVAQENSRAAKALSALDEAIDARPPLIDFNPFREGVMDCLCWFANVMFCDDRLQSLLRLQLGNLSSEKRQISALSIAVNAR